RHKEPDKARPQVPGVSPSLPLDIEPASDQIRLAARGVWTRENRTREKLAFNRSARVFHCRHEHLLLINPRVFDRNLRTIHPAHSPRPEEFHRTLEASGAWLAVKVGRQPERFTARHSRVERWLMLRADLLQDWNGFVASNQDIVGIEEPGRLLAHRLPIPHCLD